MRNTWNLMMAAIICAGLQAGCGGKEDAPPPPSGPQAVVIAMLKAMAAGDGNTAVAYYDCSIEDKEYLMNTLPFRLTLMNLGNAGSKAYGADAWEAAKEKAGISAMAPNMANVEENIQCTITGDQAVCIPKGFASQLNLAKKGNQWLIVPQPGQLPMLHQRGDKLKSILTMKTAIDAIGLKVGAKNVSADDICTEVKKVMSRQ